MRRFLAKQENVLFKGCHILVDYSSLKMFFFVIFTEPIGVCFFDAYLYLVRLSKVQKTPSGLG